MLKSLRKCHQSFGVFGAKATTALAAAALLAGCSADISRFDLGNPEGARAQSSGSGSMGGRSAQTEYGSAAYDRPAARNDVSRSDLPPPDGQFTTSALSPPPSDPYAGRNPGYGHPPAGRPSQPSYGGNSYDNGPSYGGSGGSQYGGAPGQVAPMAAHDTAPAGDMIEVRRGDTLYGLARRHGVSLNELMRVNGLTSSNLQPGQRLYLPSGANARQDAPRVAAAAPQPPAVEAPDDWTGTYTVRPGDSLYAIARRNGISLAELERYNGITDARRVMPGTVLRLPGSGDDDTTQVAEAPPVRETPPAYEPPAPPPSSQGTVRLGERQNPPPSEPPVSSPQQPTLLNGSGAERVARAETPGAASDAVSPAATQAQGSVAGSSRLRWPVVGKVVSGFGPRPDGTHNDGVNLAAPMGTDIHAAESGVVAYTGDEIQGYGNLVLVRHDNGWVTAYAHADEILVKRGDRIKRGQVIAKVGRTGQVDQPQVHFELRQGQKPVDPSPFMERL